MNNNNPIQLVIVDDDKRTREIYKRLLTSHPGLSGVWKKDVLEFSSAGNVMRQLGMIDSSSEILILCDAYMPPNCDGNTVQDKNKLFGGFWLIDEIRTRTELSKRTEVILITYLEDDLLVNDYLHGNRRDKFPYIRNKDFRFIPKPLAEEHGKSIPAKISELEKRSSNLEDILFKETFNAVLEIIDTRLVSDTEAYTSSLIGDSSKMKEISSVIEKVAQTSATVLILGESGTGKELIAHEIHEKSNRRGKKFVPINCGAIPEGLFESEMFGHEKGAFTGASRERKGSFEEADGGTIFLDEIGELALVSQAKLLRVLQIGEFNRVGSSNLKKVDVRVISATNIDIERRVAEKLFREDLFYRISPLKIFVPPLRNRREDIRLLALHFLDYFCKKHNLQRQLSEDTLRLLNEHPWPGNVRELQNVIEQAIVLDKMHIVFEKSEYSIKQSNDTPVVFNRPIPLEELKKYYYQYMLNQSNGIVKHAAKEIGVNQDTVSDKVRIYKLTKKKI